jgi:aspartate kinase
VSEQAESVSRRPVVLKFGGSSVADLEKIRLVAGQVAERAKAGPVAVVVSAMGQSTNALVADARALDAQPSLREMDALLACGEQRSSALLAIAISALGQGAVALTGWQAGVSTDDTFGDARVISIDPQRIRELWASDHVAVVAGFQGVNSRGELTTLGRGGSDTSAVVLAGALGADCEIYSDVDGIYSADPRVAKAAEHLPEVDHFVAMTLARCGARVLHARAAELASELGVEIICRATHDFRRETVVRSLANQVRRVQSVAADPRVARIDIGWLDHLESAGMQVVIDMIGGMGLRGLHIHTLGISGILSLTQRDDYLWVESRIGEMLERLRAFFELRLDHVNLDSDWSQVSCIGPGLDTEPKLVSRALVALSGASVTVGGSYTDPQTLAFLVRPLDLARATQALHAELIESRDDQA